ncbi:MAG: hypothetical protein ACR2RA_10640, partial [Geminicoccaceae bacterium]
PRHGSRLGPTTGPTLRPTRHRGKEIGDLPERYLITDGNKVFYKESPSIVVDLTDGGQRAVALVVDMEPINAELLAGAEALGEAC